MTIREITIDECKDILAIEQSCFLDSWSIEDFEYQVKSPHSMLIGAFIDEKVIGFINTVCVIDEVDINNVAVLKEYRRQHIGEELIKYALKHYSQAKKIFLEVRESNIPAISLYEKLGFIKYGERKNYYHSPTENALLMIKEMDNK